jgi:hypothetical protein
MDTASCLEMFPCCGSQISNHQQLLGLDQHSERWYLTISVSPTKKLWNTLYSGLFLIVLLGTFNCQARRSGYHSSCLGAG